MKIEAGMVVEIVDCEPWYCPELRIFIGHIGRVLKASDQHSDGWVIEGADVDPHDNRRVSWPGYALRPIPPDEKASWDEIEKITKGWNPSKQGVTT